jgi:hypothetical protein
MPPGILTLVDYNHRVLPRPKEPFVSQNPAQRDALLNELRRLDAQVGSAKSIDDLKPIYYRLEEIGQAFPGDGGMQAAITDVRNKMVSFGQRLMEMQSTAEREAAAKMPGGAFAPPAALPTQVFPSGSVSTPPPPQSYAPAS